MTIIDQYITDHYNDPLDEIASDLGISIGYASKRKIRLQPKQAIAPKEWIDNERLALVQLITNRKSGWAVEVAIERLKKLQKLDQL